MEVHHHPDFHHKKKKFKEYILEFLMLFLAVTMGFFAETIRESFGDNHKEHQFVNSLIRDINSDISAIDANYLDLVDMSKNYDSLLLLLASDNVVQADSLYYYFRPTTAYSSFIPNNRTIDELKSTGGLRLFEEDNKSDTITSYYQHSKEVQDYYSSMYLKYFEEYHKDAFDVFSYSQMGKMFYSRNTLLNRTLHLRLLNDDKKLTEKLYGKLFVLRVISNIYAQGLKDLKNSGIKCVYFLKKEYSIKD